MTACANGFRSSWGDNLVTVIAKDVIFMKALVNTFIFVIVVAPLQGGLALLLALMINQKLPGINIYRAIYFMPVVVSIVVVALLWRFIYDGNNGLLNTLLNFLTFGAFPTGGLARPIFHGARLDHRHVDLAGGWVPHGHLAFRPADHSRDAL